MRITVQYLFFGECVFRTTSTRDYQPVIPSKGEAITIDGIAYTVQSINNTIMSGGNETSPSQYIAVQLFATL